MNTVPLYDDFDEFVHIHMAQLAIVINKGCPGRLIMSHVFRKSFLPYASN